MNACQRAAKHILQCARVYGSRTMSTVTELETAPVANSIKRKLTETLEPVHLDILNESFMHNVPKGSETHFKVVVVSSHFEGKALIKRHRLVNEIVKEELEGPVHALSIVAKTPSQWEDSSKSIPQSPPCRGGAGL